MHAVIYLNKMMVEATKARVAPVSSAMLYGRGVFTTVAIHSGNPFLWSKHWSRLSEHAKKISLDLTGLTETSVSEALTKLIAVNQVDGGRARIILLASGFRDIWNARAHSSGKTDLLIMTGEPQKVRREGLTLAVSPYRSNTFSPLAGIKSLNYLDQVLSREEAQSRDFDEAVVLNERGEIVSATMASPYRNRIRWRPSPSWSRIPLIPAQRMSRSFAVAAKAAITWRSAIKAFPRCGRAAGLSLCRHTYLRLREDLSPPPRQT